MRFQPLTPLVLATYVRAFSGLDIPGLLNSIENALDVDNSDPNDTPPFDASKQSVDITGIHAVSVFVAPVQSRC